MRHRGQVSDWKHRFNGSDIGLQRRPSWSGEPYALSRYAARRRCPRHGKYDRFRKSLPWCKKSGQLTSYGGRRGPLSILHLGRYGRVGLCEGQFVLVPRTSRRPRGKKPWADRDLSEPYFSEMSLRCSWSFPVRAFRTIQNEETDAQKGPGMCRSRYHERNCWTRKATTRARRHGSTMDFSRPCCAGWEAAVTMTMTSCMPAV